ncbi:MAG: NUDIX domain-containing protein [bacterium]
MEDNINIKERSAGGIITRIKGGNTEILLVKHADNKYSFPKGHIEQGESEEEAAKREIIEETGYDNVVIKEQIGIIKRDSLNPNDRHTIKDVTMFRAEISGDIKHIAEEEIVWINIQKVPNKFWYKEDNKFFDHIKEIL